MANPGCPLCDSLAVENYSHRFYLCSEAMRLWKFAFQVMHWHTKGTRNLNPPSNYSLEQCVFGRKLRLICMGSIVLLAFIRGVVLWGCWIIRYDIVFENTTWSNQRIRSYI
ncbi:hypothetical protein KC19_VG242100 [Ceratodon purpureus]|uniref:Reverse transcriptase zinc-binding domain-containing protein n=1 Tax=Ceratodon purpureus TaxID=3225 RepID=A0A8T0HTX2_CERPU|nr:hypothetical protein KC19_VG242100 [Ceratodon purpureus]